RESVTNDEPRENLSSPSRAFSILSHDAERFRGHLDGTALSLNGELFSELALRKIGPLFEQEDSFARGVAPDRNLDHVAVFREVGGSSQHATFAGRLASDDIRLRQHCATPAPGPVGGNRRKGHQPRVEWQNGAVDGEIVGGATGRRGDENAVADQFRQPKLPVHPDLDPGHLHGLPRKSDLVVGENLVHGAAAKGAPHVQRSNDRRARSAQDGLDIAFAETIREKIRTAVAHGKDGYLKSGPSMQPPNNAGVACSQNDEFDIGSVGSGELGGGNPARSVRSAFVGQIEDVHDEIALPPSFNATARGKP
ncbi:hypothetical protein VSX64_24305, partial [Aurantimonas sp. C2-6-R+9]|nr:hypothetical protein [Aurantimonas sp. C2-6-R+9]